MRAVKAALFITMRTYALESRDLFPKELEEILLKKDPETYKLLKNLSEEKGWGNGYLVIPKGHPLHGKNYDELNELFIVHGGLTWSDYGYNSYGATEEEREDWVVGFDTRHYGDNKTLWPDENSVLMEIENLKYQIIKMYGEV